MNAIEKILNNESSKIAVRDQYDSLSYCELNNKASNLSSKINGQRNVLLLVQPGVQYSIGFMAILKAKCAVVPLSPDHTFREWKYIADDTEAALLIYDKQNFNEQLVQYSKKSLCIDDMNLDLESGPNDQVHKIQPKDNALILYTSGTSGKPKGVPLSYQNLDATIKGLSEAWAWSENDVILNVLPMHHTHGILNIFLCALTNSALCEFSPKAKPSKILDKLRSKKFTVFMAVPTIYNRLIQEIEKENYNSNGLKNDLNAMRLMVSGSAALPVRVLEKWKRLSGHFLLERYGMTEIGMALSNDYLGERVAGSVGKPLPGVSIRLINEDGEAIDKENVSGEIQIKGTNVFKGYLNNPEATQKSFTPDGWFKSGDIAFRQNERYFIMGRRSIDIIKSGGYKISALEIENCLLEHELISEAAIIGVEDEDWGEKIVAYLVVKKSLKDQDLKSWCKNKMATYKVPKAFVETSRFPKNAMGKVQKKELKAHFTKINSVR
ncbi:MAG: acyl-CoA synthetase [Flavobacteriales bacterium]|nr:acyl-CoA synthetase [Flavobacteriales bacterium]